MPTLRYGKFKGQDIRDVEAGYLEHLVTMARKTITDCAAELERRKQLPTSEPPDGGSDRIERLEKLVSQLAQSVKREPF